MLALKSTGFADAQIAKLVSVSGQPTGEPDVRRHRLSPDIDVRPYVKQIDTLAAEFPAYTNYLYMSYNATSHDF